MNWNWNFLVIHLVKKNHLKKPRWDPEDRSGNPDGEGGKIVADRINISTMEEIADISEV